jgi:hypothetical protein
MSAYILRGVLDNIVSIPFKASKSHDLVLIVLMFSHESVALRKAKHNLMLVLVQAVAPKHPKQHLKQSYSRVC